MFKMHNTVKILKLHKIKDYNNRYIIHNRSFGDEPFQAINCTGTDNQKQSNTTLHTPESTETQKRNTKDYITLSANDSQTQRLT